MTWTLNDTWIVVAGALVAASCALLGCFLVLRKMSMMGDAISHAVLPGLAIAFLLTESRASVPMFVGAVIAGLLTALLTQWIRSHGRVDEGASMGVVFTALFAIGLIIIVDAADRVDLDPGCVLYGAIEFTPLDTVALLGWEIPRAVVVGAIVLLGNVFFVGLLWKELKITSFDPALATTLGIRAGLMHALLMAFVAITTVAAFESVGSILVVAMLIVPAAAAHLLTDRLGWMIWIAVGLGVAAAPLGHVSAVVGPGLLHEDWRSTSTAGMIAACAGGLFLLAMLFAPRQGVVSRVLFRVALSQRILSEDMLGLLYRIDEWGQRVSPGEFRRRFRRALGVGTLATCAAWRNLGRRGLVTIERQNGMSGDGVAVHLSPDGREAATRLVRSHRLWEAYLVDHLGLRPDHVHSTAMRLEHVTDDRMAGRLARRVGSGSADPHGRDIP